MTNLARCVDEQFGIAIKAQGQVVRAWSTEIFRK